MGFILLVQKYILVALCKWSSIFPTVYDDVHAELTMTIKTLSSLSETLNKDYLQHFVGCIMNVSTIYEHDTGVRVAVVSVVHNTHFPMCPPLAAVVNEEILPIDKIRFMCFCLTYYCLCIYIYSSILADGNPAVLIYMFWFLKCITSQGFATILGRSLVCAQWAQCLPAGSLHLFVAQALCWILITLRCFHVSLQRVKVSRCVTRLTGCLSLSHIIKTWAS